MQDHVERRRANSNMMYWLSQQGKLPNYDAWTPKERKDFAIMWFAWSVKEGVTNKITRHSLGTAKEELDLGKWMCKQEIMSRFGETTGCSKIAALDIGTARHRPDKDTGEDEEWHREYKILDNEEKTSNFENINHTLSSTKEIQGEADKAEAQEDMTSFGLLGSTRGVSTSDGLRAEPSPKRIKVEGELEGEDLRTFNKLRNSPKAVLRTIQDNITELKRMFEAAQQPSRAKYTETIRTDITKLLPKLKSDYSAVEKLLLSAESNANIPDPEVLATSRKLDKNFEIINEISMWFRRLCPKSDKASSSSA